MMLRPEGNVLRLAGGLRVKARVHHPQVKPRKDRDGGPWVFRYWADEVQPEGSSKPVRKYQAVGPSKGDGAITKRQAEIERDRFLAKLNAPTTEAAVERVAASGLNHPKYRPDVAVGVALVGIYGPQLCLHFDCAPKLREKADARQLRIREYIGEAAAVGERARRVLNVHQIVAEKAELRHRRSLWTSDRIAKHA